jgi:hypothetical protein
MPHSNHLEFGVIGLPAIDALIDCLKLKNYEGIIPNYQNYDEDQIDLHEHYDVDTTPFQSKIETIYENIVQQNGWKILDKEGEDYTLQIGDKRVQTVAPSLSFQFDDGEVGDTIEDCTFGFSLSMRYRKCIFDAEYPDKNIVRFGPKELKLMTLCQTEILKAFPCFKNAQFYQREIFT